MNNNKTLWFTLISIAFFGFSIVGFVNAYAMFNDPEYGNNLLVISGVLYGVVGIAASINIWKETKYAFKIIIAFIILMIITALTQQITVGVFEWSDVLISLTINAIIFGAIARYVKNNVQEKL